MQTPIFNNYTGSAFLNNALQTIEALAKIEKVKEITPQLLLSLYVEHKIWNLFKRMKSYSMLFTRNGPLLNDKEFGEKIYKGLIEFILQNYETEGDNICEISGLKFQSTFEEIYEKVLIEVGYPVKKIAGKDKTINRCWFPLIGALGSDAQALPQAKYGVDIHPICLVIIQFLPFSALIYKGGILLFDSINFEFSKDFIKDSTTRVLQEISLTPGGKSVENIKDFNKGTYLLKALKLYAEKKDDYDDIYSDLNLWSFSNSGTGANCEIDRVPNQLFKKLLQLYYDVECVNDLKQLISDRKLSQFFLEKLEDGLDYWRLYPSKQYEGVGIPFYEYYHKLIGNDRLISYAKYIAFLLKQDNQLKKSELKLLEKTDAYNSLEYATMIYSILVRASENKQWSIKDHLQILDRPDTLPINSMTFSIFKMIHFYYQQKNEKYLSSALPNIDHSSFQSRATSVIAFIVPIIEKYEAIRNINIHDRLLNPQEFKTYSLRSIIISAVNQLTLEEVYEFYFQDFKQQSYGLNDLLRIYFSNPVELKNADEFIEIDQTINFNRYRSFAAIYIDYYYSKYQNTNTKELPISKFQKHVLNNFPKSSHRFIKWIEDAKTNILNYLKEQTEVPFTALSKKEINNSFEDILYDELGNLNLSFARFAIEFSLHKNFLLTNQNAEI
ncbi:MAG: hypothetical protein DHS20C18_54440 [Saprospiraceae bacterium]|nr:MAG: hypothetical protein DHS20C18_54440 [Saprospiraceae bacterium]